MRTRIALVAIAPIAIIITTALLQAATVQSARGAATPPAGVTTTTVIHQPAHPAGDQRDPRKPAVLGSSLLDLNGHLLSRAAAIVRATPTPAPAAAPPVATAAVPITPAPAGPVDTVTPAERASWERVAMCEEGGNWSADSPRFSGGLGISRANWDSYGGREFASEGAMASEDQQIMVAERIQPEPPDQYGCRGW